MGLTHIIVITKNGDHNIHENKIIMFFKNNFITSDYLSALVATISNELVTRRFQIFSFIKEDNLFLCLHVDFLGRDVKKSTNLWNGV